MAAFAEDGIGAKRIVGATVSNCMPTTPSSFGLRQTKDDRGWQINRQFSSEE